MTTEILSPLPIQHFVDNNGNALSGGQLFTYSAGTTTKIATYTDAGGGTANANPVVLNSRGEANVWLTPATAYKFVLSPSTDTDPPTNPIWTVDNITQLSAGPNTFTGTQTLSGAALNEAEATIASATTTAIGAAPANYLLVSGTTAITAFDTIQAGTRRILEFQGSLTLTHNATSLILPGGKSITTAAGDVAMFMSEGSGNWRCASYTKANGTAVAVIPVIPVTTVAFANITAPFSAGTSWAVALSKSFTLSDAAHGVLIRATGVLGTNTPGQSALIRLVRDSTAIGIGDAAGSRTRATCSYNSDVNYASGCFDASWVDLPGDTSAHTYELELSAQPGGSATAYLGQRGDDTDGSAWGRFPTTLTLQEVIVV